MSEGISGRDHRRNSGDGALLAWTALLGIDGPFVKIERQKCNVVNMYFIPACNKRMMRSALARSHVQMQIPMYATWNQTAILLAVALKPVYLR